MQRCLRVARRQISALTMPRAPLIAIVGATGTGKSELAVEIAQRFNGEIINGDAMQMYRGLPIITNKITPDERKGVPHHLLDCLPLDKPAWTVSEFVPSALEVIKEIRSRGRLPILVGGTHYYTQSLLFNDSLAAKQETSEDKVENDSSKWPILEASPEEMLAELQRVDPVMAARWHPKDTRKIRRSLEIYLQTGRKASDIYAEQQASKQNAAAELDIDTSSSLRTDTLILWLHTDLPILQDRLAGRVDKMLSQGLLSEISTLSSSAIEAEKAGQSLDTSSGIWVSIGYKEFLPYQHAITSNNIPSDAEKERLLADAVERTKIATRQYAKRQIRWIRIKLLNALAEAGVSNRMFLLDSSDLSVWGDQVEKASDVVGRFLEGSELPDPMSTSDKARDLLVPHREDMRSRVQAWERKECQVCGIVAVTESDWTQHVQSRRHRRLIAKTKTTNSHGDDKKVYTTISTDDQVEGL